MACPIGAVFAPFGTTTFLPRVVRWWGESTTRSGGTRDQKNWLSVCGVPDRCRICAVWYDHVPSQSGEMVGREYH